MTKRFVFDVLNFAAILGNFLCVCVWECKCWSLPSPCSRQSLPIVCTWLPACELSGILLVLLLTGGVLAYRLHFLSMDSGEPDLRCSCLSLTLESTSSAKIPGQKAPGSFCLYLLSRDDRLVPQCLAFSVGAGDPPACIESAAPVERSPPASGLSVFWQKSSVPAQTADPIPILTCLPF